MTFRNENRTVTRRAALLSLLTAVCVICTACGDTGEPAQTVQASTASSGQSTSVSSEISSADVTAEAVSQSVTLSRETAEPVVTESAEAAETSECTQEELPPTDEQGAPQQDAPEQTTASRTTTASSATTVTTASTTAAPPKPPAEVIIPDICAVSSPQTEVQRSDTAMIDLSNASEGYIAVSYSGKSARAKLRIVCGGVTCDHDLATGGVVEYFPLSQGSGDYTISVYEQLEGKSYLSALDCTASVTIADDVGMYLYPNKYVMFDKSSSCVYKAAEVCAGAGGTVERLAAIFAYITDNVTYDYELAATVVSGYIPDPDSVLKKRTGICFDYSSLFAAMARSQGIPTRLVIGYASPDIYHAWNEVYTEETGWITPELLLSQKGYNLVDSTFYAGAADKAAIADYISSGGNYSAIYRY